MSKFSGKQAKGAAKVHRQKLREEAKDRQGRYSADPTPEDSLLVEIFSGGLDDIEAEIDAI